MTAVGRVAQTWTALRALVDGYALVLAAVAAVLLVVFGAGAALVLAAVVVAVVVAVGACGP